MSYPSPPSTPSPFQSATSLKPGAVIIQLNPPSPPSTSSSLSSIDTQAKLPLPAPKQQPKPKVSRVHQIVDPNTSSDTVKGFVHVGEPRGGNPNGGPKLNKAGYIVTARKNPDGRVTVVHNSGGLLRDGDVVEDLGTGNDETHDDNCIKLSRKGGNASLCFCSI